MTDTELTRVIFRKMHKKHGGNVLALFPDEPWDKWGHHITCYAHVGQHGAAEWYGVINKSRPATADEYWDLALELKGLGYKLAIRQRR